MPWELRTAHPLINLRLAAHRPVILTNIASLVIAVGMLTNLLMASQQFGTPTYVDGGFGLSASTAGLVMAAPAGILVLLAPATGSLLGRFGGRAVLLLGALTMSASYVSRVFLDESVLQVALGTVFVGAGTSLALSAMPMIIMSSVPPRHTASANGVNTLCRMFGTAVSTAAIAALVSSTSVTVQGQEYPSVQTNHIAFWGCAVAALMASLLVWFIPRQGNAVSPRTVSRPRGRAEALLLPTDGQTTAVSVSTALYVPEGPLANRNVFGYTQRSNSLLRMTSRAVKPPATLRHTEKELVMNSSGQLKIDTSVHIFFKSNADLRDHMHEPFASRGFPDPDVAWFAPPGDRYAPGTANADGSHEGSDPEFVGKAIFDDAGCDLAILHPMTGGVIPDWHLGNAVLAATNEMMVERWLDSGSYRDKFRGTIRVNPNDVEGSIKEIERWKDHPSVVQIGIPMQSQEPYGRPHFKPLWRAACDANLPIAIHLEKGTGISHPPTPSGITRTYSHHVGFTAYNCIYHLLNMIAEGVFEEFPDLKVVFADGAADMLTPFIWRMDTFGRAHLEQTPWSPRMPSDYLPDHVYFVHGSLDGPGDVEFASEWLRMTGKENMLMFGSSYPDWQLSKADGLPSAWSGEQCEKVLWRNAAGLYGLHAVAPATV